VIFPIPTASDGVRTHADWLEAEALASTDGSISFEALVSVFRRGGGVDAVADDNGNPFDRGSETSQRVAEDAFAEMENRAYACNGRYPFRISQGLISVNAHPERSIYTLLLLLSAVAPTTGHNGTASLFERICTDVAEAYFGGFDEGVRAFRFGSPRKKPLVTLQQAINHLCTELGEGGGVRDEANARHKGDAGLDVVAWKHFPDKKPGKLIAFGQCAGGSTAWDLKLSELDGAKFAKKWLRDAFVVDPLRMFFLPRWVDQEDWTDTGVDGGIVFDRGRIASFLSGRDVSLLGDCKRTTTSLLKRLRNS